MLQTVNRPSVAKDKAKQTFGLIIKKSCYVLTLDVDNTAGKDGATVY